MLLNNFRVRFNLFLFFTGLLLVEGFFYYYQFKLSLICSDFTFRFECTDIPLDEIVTGFNPIIWNENGIVETIQYILLILTLIYIWKIIKKTKILKFYNLFNYFLYLYFLCILYFFLEEISWGQHFLKWQSNTFFLNYNNQGETNIHNISNLFDQLPRTLLTIWCGIPFLIYYLLDKIKMNGNILKFILPENKLRSISYILLLFVIPDLIIDKFNFHPGYQEYTVNISINEIYDFITFNYIRLSEYQELIFTFYLLNHSVMYNKYLDHKT